MDVPTWLWWSSGKDSAWALHTLRHDPEHDVTGLVTTVTGEFDRVAIHGVRRELLEAQARATGLDLHVVELPYPCTNEEYESAVAPLVRRAEVAGVERMAFGDLFLDDVRVYRESLLASGSVDPVFPLWGLDTRELAHAMIDSGVRAFLATIDPRALAAELAGRAWDHELLAELPDSVDPCGERGEFHTFAWDAPVFSAPISVTVGEVVERDGFVFTDLLQREA